MHLTLQLDVVPQRDDDASPMSTYRWDLLECWFQLFSTSQNKSQIQFRTFLKKKLVPMLQYSWRPFRWRINYLCRTGIDKARAISFLGVWKLGVQTEFNFVNFELFEENNIFGFPWYSTREDLSIDASINNVGLILTKLRWFQLFITNQNPNFKL